ncbi:SusC/RagA family TonB-linked outer membrane protein [Flavobacterium nackdongense]|uniref:TonB-dependent receptor n=1 Tax=Flavobacterium nackdongense TaxID=2547394 RepID=A0A4P6Y5K8_9FLAO|nr:TonB-dependent receptor [Flavobacterium nackdongense]QBN17446.1 TonB-dependent receptor [Flavobacterium nackdongense]
MKKPILLFLLIFASIINAQTGSKVTGTVVDSKGLSIPGVTVTSDLNSVSTDFDGKYSISVKNSKSILKFSFVGFETQLVPVGKEKTINVVLKESLSTLDEVVVIGYGTQKRSSVTGSVSKFQSEKLTELAVSRVDQALQGKIAGVNIQNTSSEAGSNPKITIRGISSITAGNNPLIIVDGQPNQDGLGSLNMADIQSVEVLKDAASAAIYGSRGASGVIIVTTKSGKTDKVRFKLNYQTGVKNPYETYPMMTSSDYVRLLYKERDMKKLDPTVVQAQNTVSANNNAMWLIEQELLGGKGTDYQDEVLRTGMYKTIGLSASGGSKSSKYYVSLGYNGDEGMMIHSDFQKFNFMTKLDMELSKNVKLAINVNPQYQTKESPAENFTNFIRYPSFLPVKHNELTQNFVSQNPQWAPLTAGNYAHPRHFSNLTYPAMGMTGLLPDGTYMVPRAGVSPFGSAQNNPMGAISEQFDDTKEFRFQGAATLTVNLAKGLDFKTMGSTYMRYSDRLEWANTDATGDGIANKGTYTKTTFRDLLWENTLIYKNVIGDHSFDAVALFSAQNTKTTNQTTIGQGYPSDNIRTLNNATLVTIPPPSTSPNANINNQIGLLSYMARLNYAYKDKYLLSMSLRTDGSSYFGPGYKWGNFPAASIGWKVNNEKFMSEVDWVSKLLLRASYGISGNNRIGDFLFVSSLTNANYISGAGTGSNVPGLAPNPNIQSNPEITWESTYQTNVGFDLSMFKNAVNISVDAYQSKTDKLLLNQPSMAFTGVPLVINNIGSMNNKGIEFEISTTNIRTKSFKWTTTANISHTENEVRELGKENYLRSQGERTEVYQTMVGDPLVQYYGFKTDGVWLSQAQIDEAKAAGITSPLAQLFIPGGLKLVDLNGDKIIDNNDRTIIGNPYPDFIWGMTNVFTYKAFDLSFSFQGSQGGQLINGDPNYNETKRTNLNYTKNRWVSAMFPGDGKTPYETSGFNWMLTDYVVEDASYVAIRDITIGFTMPDEFAKKCLVNGLRLYFSGQNMYFYTPSNYRGINTEGRSTSGAYSSTLIDGYQRGAFPIPKTVVFGLDINF